MPYSSEGRDLPFANLLKILEDNSSIIFAYHPDHLLHFLAAMRLVHAAQKEGDLFGREITIVIEVDDIESFSNIIIRKQFAVDVVACGLGVERIFGDYLLVVLLCVITQEYGLHVELSLVSVDFYGVLVFEFAVAFAGGGYLELAVADG